MARIKIEGLSISDNLKRKIDDIRICSLTIIFRIALILLGMLLQVLHPQSMRPAREGDIPVRVKNSYNPKAPGTLICRARDMSKVRAAFSTNSICRNNENITVFHPVLACRQYLQVLF